MEQQFQSVGQDTSITLPALASSSPALSLSNTPAHTSTPLRVPAVTREDALALRSLSRLRFNSSVRQAAEDAFNPVLLEDTAPLFNALARPFGLRWREAQAAAWALGRAVLRPAQRIQAVEALTRTLQISVPRTQLRRLRLTGRGIGVTSTSGFLLAIYMMCRDVTFFPHDGSATSLLIDVAAFTIVFSIGLSIPIFPTLLMVDAARHERRSRVRATTATALGRLAAPESVSVLADTLRDTSPAVHHAALCALLPLLTPDHRAELGPHVVSALCQGLSDRDETHVEACLDALEMVGDGGAIAAVEQQARRGQTPAIRVRAAQIAPILQARRDQDNAPRHLLRASDNAAVAPDVLLRAATPDTAENETYLLRASIQTQD